MAVIKPKAIVFDLDFTLWPFWVHSDVAPPFRKTEDGLIMDSTNCLVAPYPEVSEILRDLHEQGIPLAVTSQIDKIQETVIELFGWTKYFDDHPYYPGARFRHLIAVRNKLGIAFEDMIYFTDEKANMKFPLQLKVFTVRVEDGLTKKLVDDALRKFSAQKSS